MKVLIIDNYDSFTYNLVYKVRKLVDEVVVARNNEIEAASCLNYDAIILSPGPGIPKDAGRLLEIIQTCVGKIPILGICLGHQAIGEHYGAKLKNLDQVYHGVQINTVQAVQDSFLFNNIAQAFPTGRYHSWVIDETSANSNFRVIAIAEEGLIMGIDNISQKIFGLQFHPESVMTPDGELIISNFLTYAQSQN